MLAKSDDGKVSRTARFGFRATPRQEALLKKAAQITGKNFTQFVLSSACEAAENALADQRIFFVDDEIYETFLDILERPIRDKPRLRELFKETAPWEKKTFD